MLCWRSFWAGESATEQAPLPHELFTAALLLRSLVVIEADDARHLPGAAFILPQVNEPSFACRCIRFRMIDVVNGGFHRAITLHTVRF